MSSVNGSARFCTSVAPFEQHGAIADDAEAIERGEPLVTVGEVLRFGAPKTRTSPSSGSEAPVTRLTITSAAAASMPAIATRSPGATASASMRSGRSAAVVLSDGGHLDASARRFMAARASSAAKSSAESASAPSVAVRCADSP